MVGFGGVGCWRLVIRVGVVGFWVWLGLLLSFLAGLSNRALLFLGSAELVIAATVVVAVVVGSCFTATKKGGFLLP